MGAWGPGPLDNDSALDWIADVLDGRGGWESVIEILTAVSEVPLDDDGYIDLDDASAAIAAAELVATRNGKPLPHTPEDILTWTRSLGAPATPEQRLLAATAVRRIVADSELQELWDEVPDGGWAEACDDIVRRLDVAEG